MNRNQAPGEDRIRNVEKLLTGMLGLSDLKGLRFLDAGCGRGLFSLAARRLGAEVVSFDIDPESVACTQELRQRHFHGDASWSVQSGNVLDRAYLSGLGKFDVVYSWGVLHHTGAMWQALSNIIPLVGTKGRLYVAIYNDQGLLTGYWRSVKKLYSRFFMVRPLLLVLHAPYICGLRWIVRRLAGRSTLERGLPLWRYMQDLFEGYPFEVARPEKVVEFGWSTNLSLERVGLCGGHHGCNEFLFVRE